MRKYNNWLGLGDHLFNSKRANFSLLLLTIFVIIIGFAVLPDKRGADPIGEIVLTNNTIGQGAISIEPIKSSYVLGEKIVITATPSAGYVFKKWSDGYRSSANPVEVVLGVNTLDTLASINFTAEFVQGEENPSNYKIENVTSVANGPDKQIFSTAAGSAPSKNDSFVQSETGHRVTRVTDFHEDNIGVTSDIFNGYTNGYSTYTYENVTGEYMLIENTKLSCGPISLFSTDTNSKVKDLISPVGGSLCEPNDIRWDLSGKPGTEYTVYYQMNSGRGKIYKQDIVSGQSAELIYDFSNLNISSEYVGTVGDDHMSQARDATYRAIRFHNANSSKWLIGVIDLKNKQVLPGMVEIVDYHNDGRYIPPNYAYTDISPDGTWLNAGGLTDPLYTSCSAADAPASLRFYRISDLANNVVNQYVDLNSKRYGHSSWSYDKYGNEVFVSQNDCTDSYMAFNPENQTQVSPIRMPELNGYSCLGVHVQRNDNPLLGGWLLMSTYGGGDIASSNWAYNQIFMVEMLPEAEHPRIWRIAANLSETWPVCSDYGSGKYFAQAFANISFSGKGVYWGSNWGGTDNLETYKASLPSNWHETLSGEGVTVSLLDEKSLYENESFSLQPQVSNADTFSWEAAGSVDPNVQLPDILPTIKTTKDITVQPTIATGATNGYKLKFIATNSSTGESINKIVVIHVHKTGDIDGRIVNNKFTIDFLDFSALLNKWGARGDTMANIEKSGLSSDIVDFMDFSVLLSKWGSYDVTTGGEVLEGYYLSPTGSDSASGTKEAPWRTFSNSLPKLKAGDTLIVRDGTYTEDLSPTLPKGSASYRIRVIAHHGEKPILKGLVRFAGADYWTFDGINVTWNTGTYDQHMLKMIGGTGWIWENSEIWGARSFANVLVSNSPSDWTLRNNKIYDTFGGEDNYYRSHNIYVNTNLDAGAGLIERNLFFNATHGCNVKLAGPDEGPSYGSANVTVRYNTLYNAVQPLLIGDGSKNIVVERNIIGKGIRNVVDPGSTSYLYRLFESVGTGNEVRNNIGFDAGKWCEDYTSTVNTCASTSLGNTFPLDPQFDGVDINGFHPQNVAAQSYGVYAI